MDKRKGCNWPFLQKCWKGSLGSSGSQTHMVNVIGSSLPLYCGSRIVILGETTAESSQLEPWGWAKNTICTWVFIEQFKVQTSHLYNLVLIDILLFLFITFPSKHMKVLMFFGMPSSFFLPCLYSFSLPSLPTPLCIWKPLLILKTQFKYYFSN